MSNERMAKVARMGIRSFFLSLAIFLTCSAHAQTTSVIPLTNPRIQYGASYANYCLYSYSAGTTSPLATFADSTGGTQNQDPVILDSNGSAQSWLGPYSYKLAFYSPGTSVTIGSNCYGGTLQWTADNVPGAGISTVSQAFSAITAATNSNAGTFALSGNTLDLNAASAFKVPISAGAVPTTSGLIAYDSTANKFTFGVNGATKNFAIASVAACSAGQFVSSPATATTAAGCAAPSLTGSTCTNCTINGSSTFTGAINSATIGSSTISGSSLSSITYTGSITSNSHTGTLLTNLSGNDIHTNWDGTALSFAVDSSTLGPMVRSSTGSHDLDLRWTGTGIHVFLDGADEGCLETTVLSTC